MASSVARQKSYVVNRWDKGTPKDVGPPFPYLRIHKNPLKYGNGKLRGPTIGWSLEKSQNNWCSFLFHLLSEQLWIFMMLMKVVWDVNVAHENGRNGHKTTYNNADDIQMMLMLTILLIMMMFVFYILLIIIILQGVFQFHQKNLPFKAEILHIFSWQPPSPRPVDILSSLNDPRILERS